jgi:predicted DCC family thiol-disulfide oxidoreductase YuxK
VGEAIDISGRVLVVFDGRCGFCYASVRWLLRRDKQDRLRFVAMESERVAGMLERHSLTGMDSASGTMLVVRDAGEESESVLVRSDAVVTLLRELRQPWPVVGGMLGWIPRPVRDLGYRVIARWRHRIWGRLGSCPLPTAEERGRFL